MDTLLMRPESLFSGNCSVKGELMPKKINFGSGKDWREDFLNADILDRVSAPQELVR